MNSRKERGTEGCALKVRGSQVEAGAACLRWLRLHFSHVQQHGSELLGALLIVTVIVRLVPLIVFVGAKLEQLVERDSFISFSDKALFDDIFGFLGYFGLVALEELSELLVDELLRLLHDRLLEKAEQEQLTELPDVLLADQVGHLQLVLRRAEVPIADEALASAVWTGARSHA